VTVDLSTAPASLSQSGFNFLQWPHQGARNLMKAPLPELKTTSSKLLGVSSLAPPNTAVMLAKATSNDRMLLLTV